MTGGRTVWLARDAAHHDRELIVEMLDEFGPAGPYVDVVMRDLAKQQRDGGRVKTGFRVLGKKCGIDRDECRRIIEHGAAIGLFDDLEIDEDGRRFTCRVSGWEADQEKGRAASRQQNARDRQSDGAELHGGSEQDACEPDGAGPSGPEQGVTTRDNDAEGVTTRDKALRGVTHTRVTGQDRTGQEEPSSLRSDGSAGAAARKNADEWPRRLPDHLRPVAELVWERLGDLVEIKGGDRPSRRQVGEIVADFPEHDHRHVVGDVFEYWAFGAGKRTKRKNWGRVYRARCEMVPARRGGQVHQLPVNDGRSEIERFRAHQRRLRAQYGAAADDAQGGTA